jgi:hypothetical protein
LAVALLALGFASTGNVADATSGGTLSLTPPSSPEAPLLVTAGVGGEASVTVKNTDAKGSTTALKVELSSDDPAFQVNGGCNAVALGPGKACTFIVSYTAAAAPTQDATASVSVSSKKPGIVATNTAFFKVVGVAPGAALTPAAGLDFGDSVVGETTADQEVTLTNSGNATLAISSLALGGSNPDDFVLGASSCGLTLAAGEGCTTSIAFLPTAEGAKTATFEVTDDAAGSPHSVTLTGTGTGANTPVAPDAPRIGTATRSNASATVRWSAPNNGGSAITGYSVRVLDTADAQVGALRPAGAAATSLVVSGLTNGATYHFTVTATNAVGDSAPSAASNDVTPATVPGAPVIGPASSGVAGGAITATARWISPSNTGGSVITGYRVRALRLSAAGAVLATTTSATQPAAASTLSMTLPVAGDYRFTVEAINAVGGGAQSARSNLVAAR